MHCLRPRPAPALPLSPPPPPGTIFLWIFWPSFNGALAASPGHTDRHQFHCVANTVVALLGACLAAFTASAALTNKFDMVRNFL